MMDELKTTDSSATVLHFSDGTLNISEVEAVEKTAATTVEYNTKEMDWGPWVWHHTSIAGAKTLEVCDYLGESLASFFGITTPKYQFEINEYNRIMKEEENEKRERDLEMGGWTNVAEAKSTVLSAPHSNTNNISEEPHF